MHFLRSGGWFFLVPGFVALFVAGLGSDFPVIRDAHLPIAYVVLTLVCSVPTVLASHFYFRITGKQKNLTELTRQPIFYGSILATAVLIGFGMSVTYSTNLIPSGLRSILGQTLVPLVSHRELTTELFQRSYGYQKNVEDRMWDGRPKKLKHYTSSHYLRVLFQGEDTILEGVAEKWTGKGAQLQLYLSPACEIVNEIALPIKGPGVWVELNGVQQIQFLDDVCSACANAVTAIAIQATSNDSSEKNGGSTRICQYP